MEELADAYAVDLKTLCLDPDCRMLDVESIRGLCPGLVQAMPLADSANEGQAKPTVCIALSSFWKVYYSRANKALTTSTHSFSR